jgi:lysyl-tRNA synthetase class 2
MNDKFLGRVVNLRVHKNYVFADVLNSKEKKQLLIEREVYDSNSFNEGAIISGQGADSKSKAGDDIVLTDQYSILLRPVNYLGEDYSKRKRVYKKAQLIKIIRSELNKYNFIEVVTPTLWTYPSNSAINPFVTTTRDEKERFLRFTLELELKKICASTQFPVYEIGNVFRNMGLDRKHPNHEYTVLEAIFPYATLEDGVNICKNILYDFASFMDESLSQMNKRDVYQEISKYSDEERIERYKKNIRLVEEPTLFANPPASWSPLSKNNGETAQDAEIVYKSLALAHICEENNNYLELVESLEKQSKKTQKPITHVDPVFLQAIKHGLPPSVGICVGIDRIIDSFYDHKE